MKRYVRQTRKDSDGDITALCHTGELWSPRGKSGAIEDIESGTHEYVVNWTDIGETRIHVVRLSSGVKYLRTDRDSTSRNNLDDLPDC